jgi:hypothetical protein
MVKTSLRFGLAATALVASVANYAQPASAEQKGPYSGRSDMAIFHAQTKLGSMKLIDAEGRVDLSFTGTLLLTKHTNGEFRIVSGNLRKEYEKGGRTVYTGTARIVLTGKWRGLQWFGSNMNTVFYGKGFARLSGEFDRNLETGYYWYANAAEKVAMPASNVASFPIPPENVKPKANPGGTAGGS